MTLSLFNPKGTMAVGYISYIMFLLIKLWNWYRADIQTLINTLTARIVVLENA